MNILKEGVKSALVRIVRLIVYSLIILVVFYIIGLISSHKASALVRKNYLDNPGISNRSQYHYFGTDNNYWFYFGLNSNWYNNTDYDLLGIRFNKNTALYSETQNNPLDSVPLNDLTQVQGVLWDTNNFGHICYFSSEAESIMLCPINKGDTYTGFSIIANTITIYGYYNIYLEIEIENVMSLWNYDTTDIINYFENSQTGIGQIVIEQQQTTQIIQDTNDYITDNTTTGSQTQAENSLTSISGQFNDALNGWGGQWSDVTHVALEPINVMLYVLDPATACRPITLNVPFVNSTITLPCYGAAFSQFFPTLMSLVVIIFSGLYGYRTVMYIIRTLKGVIDAEDDKIEVIDL